VTSGLSSVRESELPREKAAFPIIHGMFFAVTNVLTRIQHEGDTSTTTATLAAWYHLDLDNNRMTPLPHRFVGQVPTSALARPCLKSGRKLSGSRDGSEPWA
jgi:hypothetical protein